MRKNLINFCDIHLYELFSHLACYNHESRPKRNLVRSRIDLHLQCYHKLKNTRIKSVPIVACQSNDTPVLFNLHSLIMSYTCTFCKSP